MERMKFYLAILSLLIFSGCNSSPEPDKLNDKKVRNDASYSKDYLLGKYGAVPFIDEIDVSFRRKDDEPSKQ